MKRSAAYLAGFLLLTWTSAASADEWVVYESDAGADADDDADDVDFDEDADFDEDVELQDLGVGGSSGPSKGPAKGPSSGPSRGGSCSCEVAGSAKPTGLAGLGLLFGLGLVMRGRRPRA